MPIPGSPVMNTIAPVPSSAARASSRTCASSRSRPTTGAWTPSMPRVVTGVDSGAITGLAATVPDFPFSSRCRDGPHSKSGSTRAAVSFPTSTVPGSACGLEPRRDVHRVAHRPVLDARTGPDRPDDDGPRLHAHADAEPVDPPAPADLVGELPHLLHDPQAGEERAFGVVLVRDGRAEEREHAVAGEVLDRAAERLDRTDDPADGVADHELQLLRLETFPQGGGPDEVGEQGGHEPPFLTHRRSGVAHEMHRPNGIRPGQPRVRLLLTAESPTRRRSRGRTPLP